MAGQTSDCNFFCSQFEDSHTVLWNSLPSESRIPDWVIHPTWIFTSGRKVPNILGKMLVWLVWSKWFQLPSSLKSLSQAEVSAQSKSSVKLTVKRPNHQTRTNKNYLCSSLPQRSCELCDKTLIPALPALLNSPSQGSSQAVEMWRHETEAPQDLLPDIVTTCHDIVFH